MKTTYIKYLLLTFFVVSLTSCMKDLGNYDYDAAEDLIPVKIEGYADTINVVVGDVLEIAPELKNMDDESRYTYTWYVYITQPAGSVPARDTLSTEKNLSAKIALPASYYYLVFEVRDPKLGIFVSKRSLLNVTGSSISAGWYVMKEIEDEVDVDYINNDEELIPNLLNEQFFRQDTIDGPITVGNMRLKGKPIKMIYQSARYYHQLTKPDGSADATKQYAVYHVITDKDLRTFNASNTYLLKSYDQIFYMAPGVREIQNYFHTQNYDSHIINKENDVTLSGEPTVHAKVHSIYGMTSNVGKFSYALSATIGGHSNYDLHKDFVPGYASLFAYDKTSRRFVFISGMAGISQMNNTSDPSLPTVDELTNYDLVWMLDRAPKAASKTGYVLFRDRSDNNKYLLSYISLGTSGSNYPFQKFVGVPSNARMLQADVLASPQSATCIYFAKGNKLSYFLEAAELDLSQREKDIFTFSEGENIAFISNVVETHLTVLTNDADGWNLYQFPLVGATPDIVTTPSSVYSGTGVGRYVMKR